MKWSDLFPSASWPDGVAKPESTENLSIDWHRAERFLRRTDNYTRRVIKQEFCKDPRKGAVALDPQRNRFVTPVANHTFSVVWKNIDPKKLEVEGVVLAQFDPAKEGKLVDQVDRVLLRQGEEKASQA